MGRLLKDDMGSPINSFDLGEHKKFVVLSTLSSKIKLLDNSIGETVAEYSGSHKSDQYHTAIKFSKDQSYLIQASEDHKVVLYDIVQKTAISTLRGHIRPVVTLDRHPTENGKLASGSADGTIKIWVA
jgi:WD40 repeat protein